MNITSTYRNVANPIAKRRIQAATVDALRPHVRALVRRVVPAKHRTEGEQVGAIGVLVALEKYEPARGRTFRSVALREAKRELARWGQGVALDGFLETLSAPERDLLLREPRVRRPS